MKKIMKPILFFLITLTCMASAESKPFSLALKKDQQFTQKGSIDLNVYLDLPAAYIQKLKNELGQSPEMMPASLALNNFRNNQPVISGTSDVTSTFKVLEKHPDSSYVIQTSLSSVVFSVKENLLNGFTMNYDSGNPEKNFTNIPFPIDFQAIDQQLALNQNSTVVIGKNGALKKIQSPNIPEIIPDPELPLFLQWLGEMSNSIDQLNLPSSLTYMIFPELPLAAGQTWHSPLFTLPKDIIDSIPLDLQPLLQLLDQKTTLINRDKGIATFQIEMPLVTQLKVNLPEGFRLSYEGILLKGILHIQESTGLLLDCHLTSDYSLTLYPPKEALENMPEFIKVRLVSTMDATAI
jgi:hypothetical protein